MTYPPFPTKKPSIINSETPKISLDEAMDFYDKLTALGLHPIPKERYGKAPYHAVWKGKRRLLTGRDEALKMQSKSMVSGWMLVPALEPTLRIVAIDMDVAAMEDDPETTYHEFQKLCPTPMVFYSPANGVHLYYQLRDDQVAPKRVKSAPGVELRSPDISMAIAIQGAVIYTGDKAENKGVPDGHTGWYTLAGSLELPFISDELLLRITPVATSVAESTFPATKDGAKAVHEHYSLALEDREKVVAEALDWAFKELSGDYETWTLLWMAAYHASDGSGRVAKYIIGHPLVHWSDGDIGREKFIRDWVNHQPREGGVTVSTLFHYAYQAGWMSSSSVDITTVVPPKKTAADATPEQEPESKDTTIEINTERISDWVNGVENLPRHALVLSQTGSGKTWAFKAVWERLGKPRSLVFVPSIRLALDMAKKLRDELGIPAEAYRDEDTMEILPNEAMVNVPVLVTTLQTFTHRIFVPDTDYMNRYGFVYVEECDQLLGSFSRALGDGASHITHAQSVMGFEVLREAFANDIPVWGVDATATKVSWHTFSRLAETFTFVRNTFVSPKSEVVMIPDKVSAYSRIAAELMRGGTVVAPCDTKAEAESIVATMQHLKLVTDDDSLAITADTGMYDNRVAQFASNANREAGKYRLVAYNTTMASGVSVTDVTPTAVIQFASGYLTPRVNLQLLNRYRNQAFVGCYYSRVATPGIVVKAQTLITDAKSRAEDEAGYMNLPEAVRSDMANLRDEVRALAEMDEQQQRRNAYVFYRGLLTRDGRKTKDTGEVIIQRVADGLKVVQSERKDRTEQIASSWRNVPPMADRMNMPERYDEMDVRRAIAHAWIVDVLHGNVPMEEDQQYVFNTVKSLHRRVGALTSFIRQSEAVRSAERSLANRDRAYLSMSPTISRVVLAGMLRYLFNEIQEELTNEQLEQRALPFIRVIEANHKMYSAVIKKPDRQLAAIKERVGEDHVAYALSLAKNICGSIGLKLRRSTRKGWHIFNLVEVLDFLSWYYNEPVVMEFHTTELDGLKERYKANLEKINGMSEADREIFMKRLTTLPMSVALEMKRL